MWERPTSCSGTQHKCHRQQALPQSLEHMLYRPQPNHNLRQELGPIHASPETGKYLAWSPLLPLHECLRLHKDQQGAIFVVRKCLW